MTQLTRRHFLAAGSGLALANCSGGGGDELAPIGLIDLVTRGTGGPAVVLLHGLGIGYATWSDVLEPISSRARVMAYDRAGYGQTPFAGQPRTASSIVAEFDRAVVQAGLAAPIVLVGHSQGGLYAQAIARRNPARIAGLVLIDPVVPGQTALFREMAPALAAAAALSRLGMARHIRQEYDDTEATESEVAALPVYRGPMVVLRALNIEAPTPADYAEARRGLMADMAREAGGQVIDVPGGHFIQNHTPDEVVRAVQRVAI